ncbi:FG-GAP repeat domain-containing protein [Neolewinella persica]|uniref:FG-GAP repeat domain-containing protein n=1 Tax=Neolewinella persica TaxID=70998 RepID=UPI000379B587|nr:FG-GAP-like repeat-containing protein [Neolewinella persica]
MRILKQLFLGAVAGAMFVLSACGPATESADQLPPADVPNTLSTEQWTYIQIDSTNVMWGEFDGPEWLRYFGLAAADFTGDGKLEIVTGRTVFRNPGGDMTGKWEKIDLAVNVDANLTYQLIGEKAPSILAEALPEVIRFSVDQNGDFTKGEVVARVPPTGHHNGQGYKTADLFPGKGDVEIIYASQGGLYVMDPTAALPWPVVLVGADASDEGFGVADMDGDGDLDLISGYRVPGLDAEVPTTVVWFENPGTMTPDWTRHQVGHTAFAIDRVEATDLNGDGRIDVVVAEERYPGLEPDATLWAFMASDTGFVRNAIVTQYSMNNLDLADLDQDGDEDILTAEHKGPDLALQLWKNDGAGHFTKQEIDRGKESHLGAQAFDMDGDGDLDIISIGWDQHQFVHLWRNDAK